MTSDGVTFVQTYKVVEISAVQGETAHTLILLLFGNSPSARDRPAPWVVFRRDLNLQWGVGIKAFCEARGCRGPSHKAIGCRGGSLADPPPAKKISSTVELGQGD